MDFVILKVNGLDVSKASQDEAVRIFQEANEPIVIEVLRGLTQRKDGGKGDSTDLGAKNTTSSVSVQTDLSYCGTLVIPDFSPGDPVWVDEQETPCEEQDLIETVLDDELYGVYDDGVEYEDVQLKKESEEDRFGLTLCYVRDSSDEPEDGEENVYVKDITSSGIAAIDGRLRPGDHLLQVNGVDVRNQRQAEELFRASGQEICLTVARFTKQGVDLKCPSHHDSGVGLVADEGIPALPISEGTGNNETVDEDAVPVCSPKEPTVASSDNNSGTNSSVSSKSSKLSGTKTDASNERRSAEIDRDLSMVQEKIEGIQLTTCCLGNPRPWVEPESEHIYESIKDSADDAIYCCPYEPKKRKTKRPKSLLREPKSDRTHEVTSWLLNTEVSPSGRRTFEYQENEKFVKESRKKKKEFSSPMMTLNLGTELSNSTLTLCKVPSPPERRFLDEFDQFSVVSCKTCRDCIKLPSPGGIPVFLASRPKEPKHLSGLMTHPPAHSHTMYTNAANLRSTILLQQKLLQDCLESGNCQGHLAEKQLDMEWRIKRRPDGTRYISRRTVKRKAGKEHLKTGGEERARGTAEGHRRTTDGRRLEVVRNRHQDPSWLKTESTKRNRPSGRQDGQKHECIMATQRPKHTLADGILSVTTV